MKFTHPGRALPQKGIFSSFSLLVFNLQFAKRELQRRTWINFSWRDHRMSHHVTDRVSLFQQGTDLLQHPDLPLRVAVPVSQMITGTIRVHLVRRYHTPTLRDK